MNEFSMKNVLKKNVMALALLGIYILFIILGFVIKGQNILAPAIVTSLIERNAYVFILGAGMLMCMLTGGNIDLSVGSIVCFIGSVVGLFSVENRLLDQWFGVWEVQEINGEATRVLVEHAQPLNTPLAMLVALGVGLLYGALLGFLIAYVRIPPWIATLAGYLAFRGLGTQVLTTASADAALTGFPDSLKNIFGGSVLEYIRVGGEKVYLDVLGMNIPCVVAGILASAAVILLTVTSRKKKISKGYQADPKGFVILKCIILTAIIMFFAVEFSFEGGIPVVVLWIGGVLLIYGIITEKTTIGRHFMTVGGNAESARLSGINNRLVMFFAYLNMAVLTVIAAMIVTVRASAANSSAGEEYELDAIAACIVGGVSAYGGSGTIIGMVVGATMIGVINQGMQIIGVDQNWIKIVKGLVLLAAVVFEIVSKQGKNAKKDAKPKKAKAKKGKKGEAEAEPEQPSEEASELEATVVSEDTEAAPVPDAGLATSET
ncbi:MAG: sugar ABC transporter permease [Clostridiales bacterium]|nr:sugar ABC transporter permease [Clostridiales bacterium]